ncbi:MAG TPA: glycosyltransferase [Gaiellaceae bacterium]|nr:glycosyltransferase [Gaiellaceae bacterium]
MRILLVSQMYPGPEDPDLGAFVQGLERQLLERGHEVERAVLDRRGGGKTRYLRLGRDALAAARRFRPDVVYAHFLVPTGLLAALASRAPLVVTAHGRDVRNVGAYPGVRAATRFVVRRAAAVVAVSDYLRRELESKVPEARGRVDVVDCGVDLDRFTVEPAPEGPTTFLCVGSLIERKNVTRLAEAFGEVGSGSLTFVGDGPLRAALEGRPGVTMAGRVPHEEIPGWISRSHVLCQPSLIEPFGLALLEAMAAGRSVVGTRVGGPPEFVPSEAGALVDPTDVHDIARGMRAAAALPRPNQAARAAAEGHDLRRQAERVEEILQRAARGRQGGARRAA